MSENLFGISFKTEVILKKIHQVQIELMMRKNAEVIGERLGRVVDVDDQWIIGNQLRYGLGLRAALLKRNYKRDESKENLGRGMELKDNYISIKKFKGDESEIGILKKKENDKGVEEEGKMLRSKMINLQEEREVEELGGKIRLKGMRG
ncbi:hypothetical protein DITRI_Ditri16bG0052400 [Diplodiscus trichospermus]